MSFPGSGLPSGGAAGRPPVDMNDPNMKMMQSLMESCFAKTAMSGVAGFGLGGIFGMFMASMAYDTPFHTPTPTAPGATPAAGAAGAAGKTATTAATTGTASTAASTTAATTAAAATAAKSSIPKPVPSIAASTVAGAAATASLSGASPAGASKIAAAVAGAAAASSGASGASGAVAPAGAASAAAAASPAITLTEVASLPLRQQLAIGFRDMGARSWSTAKNFGTVGALFTGIECGIEGLRAKNDMTNGVAAGCLTGAILARNAGPQAAAFGCAGFAAFSAAIDAYLRMPPSDD